MKKRLFAALVLALCMTLCVLLCACSQNAEPTETVTEVIVVTEAPQAHTIAPTDAEPVLEWCPVEDCELFFNDSDGVAVLNEKDISMFALSGTDDNACLIFKLSENAKAMMEAAQATESFTVVLNGEEIGTAYFADSKEELTLSGPGYERLCEIASAIRGLE
ncbi:MAG: hypothetical protein IJH32_00825 [Ruminococcus sp.]|nr:hypothetical protein [Ruminococcus sp.]